MQEKDLVRALNGNYDNDILEVLCIDSNGTVLLSYPDGRLQILDKKEASSADWETVFST